MQGPVEPALTRALLHPHAQKQLLSFLNHAKEPQYTRVCAGDQSTKPKDLHVCVCVCVCQFANGVFFVQSVLACGSSLLACPGIT